MVPEHMNVELKIAKGQPGIDAGLENIAQPSPYACPECHGVLMKLEQEGRVRFRCHTGHAYSVHSLLAAVNEGIDESLWNSIRCLEEGSLLLQHMSDHAAGDLNAGDAGRLSAAATQARDHAGVIRELAEKTGHGAGEAP